MTSDEIEWNPDTQSPDDIGAEVFERMVADGFPQNVAASLAEVIQQGVVCHVRMVRAQAENARLKLEVAYRTALLWLALVFLLTQTVAKVRPVTVWWSIVCGVSWVSLWVSFGYLIRSVWRLTRLVYARR